MKKTVTKIDIFLKYASKRAKQMDTTQQSKCTNMSREQ